MHTVTKAQFAELAGISRPRVTKLCQGRLAPAMTGQRVDLDHDLVAEYLRRGDGYRPKSSLPLTGEELDRVTDAVFQRVVSRLARAIRGDT